MKEKLKKKAGITLIALVLTIIVLLILAGVSIATLTGENGILTRASKATDETRAASVEEAVNLWKIDYESNNYGSSTTTQDIKELVEDLVEQKLLTENEKDEILGNASKDIEASYQIKIGERTIKFANENWDGEKKVNAPVLKSGMTPVYWDDSGNEIKKGDEGFDESQWYEYKAAEGEGDNNKSRWANAKTEDDSYWVWIPRYEYKLTPKGESETAGKIEVKFIPTTVTEADTENYRVHPAFKNGRSNNYKNGEWDSEISGIWVAKYEMGLEEWNEEESKWKATELTGKTNETDNVGDLAIEEGKRRAVSKPGISSWRFISIGKSYDNSYNYDRSKESHLMKNSEWGAVAYLTHSQYGRNGKEITIHDKNFYTGGAEEANSITTNKLQSTTGNESGIYDISGGAWERVAGYITNGNPNLKTYGSTTVSFTLVATFTKDTEGYKTLNTKYSTVYPFDTSDTQQKNGEAYSNASTSESNYGYGDAILETSTGHTGSTGWFGDYSCFAVTSTPFFIRGGSKGDGTGAGAFTFHITNGHPWYSYGFRTVLVCE